MELILYGHTKFEDDSVPLKTLLKKEPTILHLNESLNLHV